MKYYCWFLLLINISAPNIFAAEAVVPREDADWERYLRGFRREHHFAFSLGVSQGTWDVKSFGSIKNRQYANSGTFSRLQYSYHIQVWKSFGYILGSQFGYLYESVDRYRPFKPAHAVQFPGALAGITLNMGPYLRANFTGEVYMERHDDIEDRDRAEPEQVISVTMVTYDWTSSFDIFYDLNWAVRFEMHKRMVDFVPPFVRDGDEEFGANSRLRKHDQWAGLGIVYHLL